MTSKTIPAPGNRARIFYLDILRIAAVAAVILFHVSSQFWSVTDRSLPEFGAMCFYDGISIWGTPMFVMISGALMLDPDRNVTPGSLWKKRIPHLVFLYLLWGLLYGLISGGGSVRELVKAAVFGYYHLWFLLMLAGLYAALPVFRAIARDRMASVTFAVLAAVWAALLALCRIPGLARLGDILANVHFYLTLGYASYFVLGHVLHASHIDRNGRTSTASGRRRLLEVCLYAASAVAFAYNIISMNYDQLGLHVMIEAAAVFVLARRLSGKEEERAAEKALQGLPVRKAGAGAERMADLTLGMYLIHPAVIMLLDRLFGLNTLTFDPRISIPVIAVLVFVISAALTAVIRAVPVIRKTVSM